MLHGWRGTPAEAEDLIREYCPTKEDVRKESRIRDAIGAIEEASSKVETTASECELWKEVAAETVAENMQAWWQAAVAAVAVGVPQRRLDVALAGLEGTIDSILDHDTITTLQFMQTPLQRDERARTAMSCREAHLRVMPELATDEEIGITERPRRTGCAEWTASSSKPAPATGMEMAVFHCAACGLEHTDPLDDAAAEKGFTVGDVFTALRDRSFMAAPGRLLHIQLRFYKGMNFFGDWVQALVDSGSQLSLIHPKLLLRLKAKGLVISERKAPSRMRLSSAMCGSSKASRIVVLEFRFESPAASEITFRWAFWVIPNLIKDVFIGSDFLDRFAAAVSFADDSLTVKLPPTTTRQRRARTFVVAGAKVTLSKDEREAMAPFQRKVTGVVPMRIAEPTTIRPWGCAAVPGVAPKLFAAFGRDAVVWVSPSLAAVRNFGIAPAQGFVATQEGTSQMVLWNMSPQSCFIPQGTVVANLVPLDLHRQLGAQQEALDKAEMEALLRSLPADEQLLFRHQDFTKEVFEEAVEWATRHSGMLAAAIRAFHKDHGGPTQKEIRQMEVPKGILLILQSELRRNPPRFRSMKVAAEEDGEVDCEDLKVAGVTLVDDRTGESFVLQEHGAEAAPLPKQETVQPVSAARKTIMETVPEAMWPNHVYSRDMTDSQLSDVMGIVKRYLHAWIWPGESLPGCSLPPVSLESGAIKPTYIPPIRYGHVEREAIRKKIRELLRAGIIEEGASPFSAPIVLAKKRDGSYRFCVSFVELNKRLRSQHWPLPRGEDYFDELADAVWFSSFDLAQSFFQMRLAGDDGGVDERGQRIASSQEMCSFSTTNAQYRFKRLAMGLKISSEVFMRAMDGIMAGLKWSSVAIFIDDLLVYSPNWKQHLVDVEAMLKRTSGVNLKISPKKTRMGARSVEFLGFEVSALGRTPSKHKTKSITAMKVPTCIKDVRSSLGLFNFYRRWVRNYAKIAEPLTQLTSNKYKGMDFKDLWGAEQQSAFETLKKRLSSYPILRHPDYSKPFFIMTDASGTGIGAVLEQRFGQHRLPVAFVSRTLKGKELTQHVSYKELLAIGWSLTQWRGMLLHAKVHIRVETDHIALLNFMRRQTTDGKLARLQLILSDFDIDLHFRSGEKNGAADCLSRLVQTEEEHTVIDDHLAKDPAAGEDIQLHSTNAIPHRGLVDRILISAVTTRSRRRRGGADAEAAELASEPPSSLPHVDQGQADEEGTQKDQHDQRPPPGEDQWWPSDKRDIRTMQMDDAFCAPHIVQIEETAGGTSEGFSVKGGLLYAEATANLPSRLVIPKRLRAEVLTVSHDFSMSGHYGARKVLRRLERRVYWPGMSRDVDAWVSTCKACIQFKHTEDVKKGMTVPLTVSNPWDVACLDIYGPLRETGEGGYTHILVITDKFSNFLILRPLRSLSAQNVAEQLVQGLFTRFGLCKRILVDNGRQFGGKVMARACKLLGINRKVGIKLYHNSNSKCERAQRHLRTSLSAMARDSPRAWHTMLNPLSFAYNTSVIDGFGSTPFFLNHGRHAVEPLDLAYGDPNEEDVKHDIRTYGLEVLYKLQRAYRIVRRNAFKMRQLAKHKRDKGRKHGYHAVGDLVFRWVGHRGMKGNTKLDSEWQGPLVVTHREGENIYYTKDPHAGAYRRLHVSQLRACPVLDGTDLFDLIHGTGHHDSVRSQPCKARTRMMEDLVPPTEDDLMKAEAALAEDLPADMKEAWKAAVATGATVCAASDIGALRAEEVDWADELSSLSAMDEHQAAEDALVHDYKPVAVEAEPVFVETDTGRLIPVGRAKDTFRIEEIIGHRHNRVGPQYLVRWTDLRLPTWENGDSLSPVAVDEYEKSRHARKLARTAERAAKLRAKEDRKEARLRKRQERQDEAQRVEEARKEEVQARAKVRQEEEALRRKRKSAVPARANAPPRARKKRKMKVRGRRQPAPAATHTRKPRALEAAKNAVTRRTRAGRQPKPTSRLLTEDGEAIAAGAMMAYMAALET
jgi:hypothetical protein